MASRARQFETVSRWAATPSFIPRLERLVMLTQRTELIMNLLRVPAEDERTLSAQVKTILEQAGVEYAPPRGKMGDRKNTRIYSPRVRFGLTVLLSLLDQFADESVLADDRGGLSIDETLDRLINTYLRYMQLQHIDSPRDAEVSFEQFVKCWEGLQNGEAHGENCDNCGSTYFNFVHVAAHNCPVCAGLNLAIVTRGVRPPVEEEEEAARAQRALSVRTKYAGL